MAANEVRFAVEAIESPPVGVESEYECRLMIEALSRELTAVKDHLAFLTHRLYTEGNQREVPTRQGEVPTQQGKSPTQQGEVPTQQGEIPTQQAMPPHTSPNRSPLISLQQKHTRKKCLLVAAGVRRNDRAQAHYLSLVDCTEGARADARKQCLVLMQRHIQEQLTTLRRRSGELGRRLAKREHRKRLAKLKLKPPRYRSSGEDDTSFLGNVYLSSFYKIVGEEHRLRCAGQLQSVNDLKKFWEDMLCPLIPHTTPTPEPTTQMCADNESDDDGYTNSWALTALPPESGDKIPVTSALYNDEDLEFVPSILPKLRSVSDFLDEGKQLKKEALQRTHPPTGHGVEDVRRCVHQMYQQSRANEMAMRKLLPPSPTFDLSPLPSSTHSADTPPPQSTLLLHHSTTVPIPVNKADTPIQPRPSHTSLLAPLTMDRALGEGRILAPLTMDRALGERRILAPLTMDRALREGRILAPLTMDRALEGRIIEPKCKSSLWTNFITVQR